MKFTVNAEKCLALVSDVAKGVGNNKLLPITSMIGLELRGEVLYLSSTDGANILRITTDVTGTEDGYATVTADIFVGLISKLADCSSISFETNNNILAITGFKGVKVVGTYKLELPLDEGKVIKFIDFDSKVASTLSGAEYDVSATIIDDMRNSCKQALATDVSESCYANYLIGDKIVATDRTRAVFVDTDIVEGKAHLLLGRNFVELLSLAEENVTLRVSSNGMYATDNHGTEVFTNFNGALSDYNEAAIGNMLKMEFPSMCKIRKSELLNTLNRMTLFSSKFDNNGIDIDFKDDKLVIKSLKNSAVEEIEYTEFVNVKPCDIRIDILLLMSHIKAYASDIIELYFGNPTCIKLIDGNVTQIIALVRK